MIVVLAVTVGVLYAVGVHLVLQRVLTRIIVGVALMSHGANLLLLAAGGPPGRPPLIGSAGSGAFSDPLPQALVLTAIVITFSSLAFVMALAFRGWAVHRHDLVEDDIEDRRIAREGTTEFDREEEEVQ